MSNTQVSDVVERFMRYVQVDSQSDEAYEMQTPSTKIQFDMAQMLKTELEALGAEDIKVDDHAYVTASYPASKDAKDLPALGFCAHIDTAPDAPAQSVHPHIVHYEGEELVCGVVDGKKIATTPEQCPYLERFQGQDIICSDGTTLLSADDKAGVAEILSLIARLKADPSIAHPEIKIAFVPDEEIGDGAELLDIEDFGATWAYTVDGEEIDEFSYECFNAAEAKLIVHGTMVHPGSAKNIMVNAITVLMEADAMLPVHDRPEYTEGYEGFFHPTNIEGSAFEASCSYIIRDHDADKFARRQQMLQDIVDFLNKRYGQGTVEVVLKQQYRNMAEKFDDCQFLVDNAVAAMKQCGIDPEIVAIRGGTDGAQLTFRGLPCPNIATGGCQAHSIREFIPVSTMETTVDILTALVEKFAVPQV